MQTFFNLALASLKKLLLTVDPKSTSLSYNVCDGTYSRCLLVVGFLVLNTYHARVRYKFEKTTGFTKWYKLRRKGGGGYHADSKFNLDNPPTRHTVA